MSVRPLASRYRCYLVICIHEARRYNPFRIVKYNVKFVRLMLFFVVYYVMCCPQSDIVMSALTVKRIHSISPFVRYADGTVVLKLVISIPR